MGFLSFLQLAVAACGGGGCIPFFRTLLVQLDAPAPQTTRRLVAVFPNVAENLAVLALRKAILSFIGFYPDYDVAKAWNSEHFLGTLN
jgi:hypothetical protein